MKQFQNLSRRERQIMNIIFQHGAMTAKAVMEQLPDPPSYATVRSILRILEEKGHLSHFKEGRQFIYKPVIETEKVKHNSLSHLLKTFFKGSISEAVATFINHPESNLTLEELDELSEIIEKAKRS